MPTPITESNEPDISHLIRLLKQLANNLPKVTSSYMSQLYTQLHGGGLYTSARSIFKTHRWRGFLRWIFTERINPGDSDHRFETILKIVSAQCHYSLEIITDGAVVTAGIHQAPSIKVAEAAKVIENTQRDSNIDLLMNYQKFSMQWVSTHMTF